jgi:tight adherence protein C
MEILLMCLLALIIFVVILLIFPSDGKDLTSRLSVLEEGVNGVTGIDKTVIRSEELNKPFVDRVIRPIIDRLSGKDKNKAKTKGTEELKKMLAQAGFPGGLTSAEFAVLQNIIRAAFPVMFIALTLIIAPKFVVAGSAFGIGVGFLAPRVFLQRKIKTRLHNIQRQLPDVLDLLTVAVEAGLGFDAACDKVVEKMSGPIPDEFSLTLRQMRMGQARKDAFKSMALRVDQPDLNGFVSAIIQADQLGVSIGQVLRIQSDQLRERRRQRAEEEAAKAPVKMMIPLVFFIFPNVGIVIGVPALFQMLEALS